MFVLDDFLGGGGGGGGAAQGQKPMKSPKGT
jgi:hypothetical protein